MSAMAMASCEDYTLTLLDEDAEPTTLHTLRAGRVAVFGASRVLHTCHRR